MRLQQRLEALIGLENSVDLAKRELEISGYNFTFTYDSFLSDSLSISRVIKNILNIEEKLSEKELIKTLSNNLITHNLQITSDLNVVKEAILWGDLAIVIEGISEIFIVEVKDYPTRSLSEPESEKVVRGSRDGFTEKLGTNIGLIRRRLGSGHLQMISYVIGNVSKTKVVLVYLDNVIEEKIIKQVKEKLAKIKVTELTMSDKALEELLLNNSHTPYPLVKYTERPDTFAIHLYQGMFGILVDTSPSAILGPVSIFDHMQHAEEYRQTVVAGSYLRLLRFLGILISFLSMPVWYALSDYKDLMNPFFQNMIGNIPNHYLLAGQLILIELGIELIRMASIHTPNALSTSMGIVAGIIIGDMAISVGLFTEQIVLLGALSAIGSYITPSYELSLANKIIKLVLLLMVFIFKLPGLIIALVGLFIYLMCLKSFSRPYLYPLIPFNAKALYKQIFRVSYAKKEKTNKKQ